MKKFILATLLLWCGTARADFGEIASPDQRFLRGQILRAIGRPVNFCGSSVTSCSGTVTLNLNSGTQFYGTASGNITFAMTNMVAGSTWSIRVTNTATPETITWPSTTTWDAALTPVLSANNVNSVFCSTRDGVNINCSSAYISGSAFTTWNALDKAASTSVSGNTAIFSGSGENGVRTLIGRNSGKFYCEATILQGADAEDNPQWGLSTIGASMTTNPGTTTSGIVLNSNNGCGVSYNGASQGTGIPGCPAPLNGVLQIAFNAATGAVWFNLNNGNWNNNGSASPSSNTGAFTAFNPGAAIYLVGLGGANNPGTSSSLLLNCGGTFNYTPPSGFVGFQ